MRLLHVPLDQLRALEAACPGLLDAVTSVVQEGVDPTIKVIRIASQGERPRWYVEVGASGARVLVLNATDLSAMAAAVPIFLVDLVQEIREELGPLFADGTMDGEIAKLIPFLPGLRGRGRPS
jgi:hypothetical protein